ncbi:hypothetical protein [Ruegeria lacuscaerulensis]|uniref:hypothetical protein n=1 Tax=Ruegeria lacuscaerulensis TaxID=55218 RepID=UPI00147F7FE8|nr:hypothetical protein [Ruegeria lacuscaerulensis]
MTWEIFIELGGPGFLGALIGVLVASLVQIGMAFAQRRWEIVSSDVDHFRQQYSQALGYFDGGTQKRNIGISILTSLWDHEIAKRHPNVYRKSCALLFCNQCLYILTAGGNQFESHEQDNLRRMLRTIQSFDEFLKPTGYKNQKEDICKAIDQYERKASTKGEKIGELEGAFKSFKKVFCSGAALLHKSGEGFTV